jgi:alkylation response protein AidB-like acyl-CoA dehydrogenase
VAELFPIAESEEQAALREATRRFLTKHGNSAGVRHAMAEPLGYDTGTWKRLTGELGLTALAVPEKLGGVGASLAEVAVVVSELGRTLLPAPYLSTALAAATLAGSPEAAEAWLPGLVAGEVTAALVLGGDVAVADGRLSGTVRTVPDAPSAGVLVVGAGGRLFAVAAPEADVVAVPAMDPTRRQGDVTFPAAPAVERAGADPSRLEDLTRTMLAVESAGAAARALEITVDYLKTRVQFGRPIGTFQALKHRCADLAVGIASGQATAAAALAAALGNDDDLGVLGPLAKLYCTDVFVRVAAEMIQLHGGIGFTWEHDAHLYFKRAKSNQLQFGTPSELRALVGRRAGLLS